MILIILQAITFIIIAAFVTVLLESLFKWDMVGIIVALLFTFGGTYFFIEYLGATVQDSINVKWAVINTVVTFSLFAYGNHVKNHRELSGWADGIGTFFCIGLYACLF